MHIEILHYPPPNYTNHNNRGYDQNSLPDPNVVDSRHQTRSPAIPEPHTVDLVTRATGDINPQKTQLGNLRMQKYLDDLNKAREGL